MTRHKDPSEDDAIKSAIWRIARRESLCFCAIERWVATLVLCILIALSTSTAYAQSTSVLQAAQILSGGETRPASSALQPTSSITIEAWVTAPSAATGWPAFVSYGIDTSPYESYILQAHTIDGTSPVNFFFLTGTGQSHSVSGTTLLQAGTQYFLAATYDGSSVKVYVNGQLETTTAISGSLYYPTGGGLGLGRKFASLANNFSGTTRGAAIYNAALTAAQISAHYAAGPPALVFEQTQVASGGETRSGSTSLQPASAVSVEAWITAPSSQTGWPAFVSYGIDTSPYESYILQAHTIDGTSPTNFFFLTGTGQSHSVFGTTNLQTGAQYLLTATYDGSAAKIYLNGQLETTTSISGSLYYPSGGGLGLSRKYSTTANNFSGTLRGVGIYSAALTADQVAAHYQASSPPTIPTSFSATPTSNTQINLIWTASTDVIGITAYLIERCQGSGCTNFAEIADVTGTTYNNTGLTSGTTYNYRIRAVNAKNNVSDYSSVIASTTQGGSDSQAPTSPTGLTATAVSGNQINLSWTASTDNVGVTGYLIERCAGASCNSFAQIATVTSTSYSDTGLSASTSYTYRVRAKDAANNLSGYSNSSSATTLGVPSAPTGLSAIATSSAEIDISWSPSSGGTGVTGYLIERCQGASCSGFSQVGTSNTITYFDAGLAAATSYSYRVRAIDSTNNVSAYSSVLATSTLNAASCD